MKKYPYQAHLVREYMFLKQKYGNTARPSRVKALAKLERYMSRTV